MPRINVKDGQVHERSFEYQGKTKIVREQRAALDLGGGYELPFRVGLGSGAVHPVGSYDIDPECFTLGKYGDLELSRFVKLVPVAAEPVRAVKSA